MRKRRILLVLSAALVLLLAGIFLSVPREPSYAGRPLSDWVLEYADVSTWLQVAPKEPKFDTMQRYLAASNAIVQIGPNANPYVLRWIQYDAPAWKYGAYDHLEKFLKIFHIQWHYRDKGILLGNTLMGAFPVLAPSLDEASITELSNVVNQPSSTPHWNRAVVLCSHLGPKGVPILVHALTNASPKYRAQIISPMWQFWDQWPSTGAADFKISSG